MVKSGRNLSICITIYLINTIFWNNNIHSFIQNCHFHKEIFYFRIFFATFTKKFFFRNFFLLSQLNFCFQKFFLLNLLKKFPKFAKFWKNNGKYAIFGQKYAISGQIGHFRSYPVISVDMTVFRFDRIKTGKSGSDNF
jgi:hypothetical protein